MSMIWLISLQYQKKLIFSEKYKNINIIAEKITLQKIFNGNEGT